MLGVAEAPEIKPETGRSASPYLLIVSDGNSRSVFPVDEVGGIHHFNSQELKKVPETVAGAQSNYAAGILPWRDRAVGCLDANLLFYTLRKSLS